MTFRVPERAVAIVAAAAAIDVIGFGIIAPVLPALVTRLGRLDLAAATRVGGWLLATFAIAQFFAGPVIGALGDRYGRRPVLLACMLCFGCDYLLQAAASTLAWLFAGRLIAGVSGALYGPASAVLADVMPPDQRASGFGVLGASFGIGFVIGPALGGLIATLGPRAPFVAAAALAFGNAAIMAFLLPETLSAANRRPFRLREATVVAALRPLLAAGPAAPLLAAWFLWQLGSTVYPATWGFWATIRLGWGPREIGWSLAWVGLMMGLVQLTLTGRVVAALGERRAAVIGIVADGVCLLAFAFVDRAWQVYLLFPISALGVFAWPALNGLLSRMVDATRQGALQGGIGAMNAVAAVIGPLLATQALAWGVGRGVPGAAFGVAGALLIAAALLIATLARPATPPAPVAG